MPQVVHPCSVTFHEVYRSFPIPAAKAVPPVAGGLQLRLPIQGAVNRSDILRPYTVDGPFRAVPDADPQPDSHAYFSSQVDEGLGICPVLSPYAVAQCLLTRRLF
jgi:hypothetical protein